MNKSIKKSGDIFLSSKVAFKQEDFSHARSLDLTSLEAQTQQLNEPNPHKKNL
jgi:hypothetical protein